ncbi:MAG TPA: glycine oxidase ThiO [Chloroflexota bacterium]
MSSLSRGPAPEVVVVGGGVIGCAIAWALAGEGARVRVLERSGIASESSGAAAGILAPRIHATDAALFALAMESHRRLPALAEALRDDAGVDVEYVRTGVLELAHDAAGEQTLLKKTRQLQHAGHELRWLEPKEVLEQEPNLAPDLRGALFDPDGFQIHPLRFTQALARAAAHRGVEFCVGTEALGIKRDGAVATAVQTSGGDIAAGHVVLAPGAWASRWSADLGFDLPVFPARGQILALAAIGVPLRRVVYGRGVYLLPRRDGTVIVGATDERAGFDKSLTPAGLAWLLSTAPAVCPALASARFDRAWTGLRPGSPDEVPIVGPAPGWDNLTIATGHYRNGIMLTPVTAAIVADYVLRGETALPASAWDPARFASN